MKRATNEGITRLWLDTCLECKGGTYPAQLMYQERADMACNKITAAITRAGMSQHHPIQGRFGSLQRHRLHQQRQLHHLQDPALGDQRQALPHQLGLEVPYRWGSQTRRYLPDFIVLVDDGHGPDDLLHLIVEVKGDRGEDAKEKKSTMDTYWIPGVNHLGSHGRWAFAEFTDVHDMDKDFSKLVEPHLDQMLAPLVAQAVA